MNGVDENNIIWGGFKSALTNGVDVALVDAKYSFIQRNGTICFNMNHWGNYNYGGWKGSDLRYDILGATSQQPSDYGKQHTTSCVGYDATASTLANPKADTLLAALPSELRSVMRLWTRWVDAVGNSSNVDANIKATVDAITLLAESEIYTNCENANSYERYYNKQIAYYANGNGVHCYKCYRYIDTDYDIDCLLSSPACEDGNSFVYAFYHRDMDCKAAYCRGASQTCALAPAFKT